MAWIFCLHSFTTKHQRVITPFEINTCLALKLIKQFCSSSLVLPLDHDPCFKSHSFYASLIDNSTHIRHLNQIHNQLIVSGLQHDRFVMTKLVTESSNLGHIFYARKLFDKFPIPDCFMLNAIIRSYSRNSMFRDTIEMYRWMRWVGMCPDRFTFSCVVKACTELLDFGLSCLVHAHIIVYGFGSHLFVQNGLVVLYAKCGRVGMARMVFDKLYDRTIVSWTAIISGYAQNGEALEALRMFNQMRSTDVKPDWISLVSVLKAYTDVDDLEQGRSLHGCVIKTGLEEEPDLVISLTAFYAKCGQVTVAKSFFDQMKTPNVMMWNAMISGYAKNGHAEEAVDLFRGMISRNVKPDSITVRSAILACAQVGSLKLAQWMDDYVAKSKYRGDVFVNTTLIDMYAKCGSVESARSVFDCASHKDVVMWSAMIMGYGLHGQGMEAIRLYDAMKQAGVCPNDVTFIGLLAACSHSGLVKQGWELFHCMRGFGIKPRNEHYSCVVDLLGRAGYLEQAFVFILKMPIEPSVSVWGALLSACRIHRCVTMGEYAAEKLFSLDPYNTGHYVQLSNLYASSRMWDRVAYVRVLMKEKGLTKYLGYSVIEINGKLNTFYVGDMSHPRAHEIFDELQRLERRLKDVGFIPHTESVLHDLNYEEKEENLCLHSERIAVAYGLISTAPGTTLRITKNLRACVNCHSAIKLISKLVEREIIVRDANRFHHFKDGLCSCGDYW
ncbi:pentatricopeptide repeat-containing protein At3g12770 [Cicer arietinum]|uniref:Pentatricopeptide repeat-containing protein At3g12770 n=1 Tax=Cicer arietinum TaxID=3827 RepID=A0A1S3E0B3_CICAR|nr:pentatricopeptide repeat-containing protein At3g12770 [Cicer arietinum]XP_027188877.1 pentatricopeptide repeat-containing protein At3g12770 [Cicer arietinum]XP_027188878.1 pentatricopeptide repeat-containing protein At3g12770 [Cicer arietinum]XP_027188879.1 pentatricopeptide repeat-containing protein At3g12770 [Cicer arietinum]